MKKLIADRRLWLVLAAIAVLVLLRWSGLHAYLSLDTLKQHRASITAFVEGNFIAAAAAFLFGYAAVVAFSLPGATIMTLAGGFFFGVWAGAPLAVTGATIGATLVFLFARSVFGENAIGRFGETAAKLAAAIRREATVYLLVLRLVPLFPFFLVNLVPAFVGVRLTTFVFTTFFGIIPGTTVYSLAGAGLGSILDQGGEVSARSILTPEIIAGLVGLALLTLASIPVRAWLAKSADRSSPAPDSAESK